MPVIKALPSPKVIKGLRGVLDFYCWKGLNCVRSWPHIAKANRSPASMESAALFGLIVQGYSLLGGALKTLFIEDAADQPRTGRDLYISAVLGHLHETTMSDITDLLSQATAYLLQLTALINALNSVGTDQIITLPGHDGADPQALLVDGNRHLQADVLSSPLPTDAATATNQDTVIARLNLITKLEHTLATVHTDQLIVRAQDQLWSYKDTLWETLKDADTAAGNIALTGATPPANELWVVTNMHAFHINGAPSRIEIYGGSTISERQIDALLNPIARVGYPWAGQFQQTTGHEMIARFFACAEHSSIYFNINGFKMTRET